ncbi:MAG: hydroxyethylthiazole kinase, partial [Clostridia bacterium]|nr:hydroxyethylthiazole kinase [Clostridia bacterium]
MEIIKNIREKNPLVHCITNTVTINDCANALLAIGARPVMAEHPDEAAEITA